MAAKAFSYSGFIAGPREARMVARFRRDGSGRATSRAVSPGSGSTRRPRPQTVSSPSACPRACPDTNMGVRTRGPRHLGSCLRRHELEAGRAGLQEALGLSERVHGVLATFGHFRIRLDLHPTKVVHPMSPGA